ncbi:hypothetical protein ACE01N_00755 [Saccharicrinis sp. FJH2]|uniref:hypothetical protein n=1 Tax=Saccharicrinis sp. FJH65 TaxID=3344659 RepID=UPI0035F22902
MRTSILIVLLTGYVSILFSQENVQLNYSEPEFTTVQNIISAVDSRDGVLQVLKKDHKRDFYVESYNSDDLKLINTEEIKLSAADNASFYFTPVDLVNLNNENYMVLSAIDPGNMKQYIAIQQIDKTGKAVGKVKQIGSFKIGELFEQYSMKVVTSANHTFLTVMAPVSATDEAAFTSEFILYNATNQSIGYYLLTTDYEAQWTNVGKIRVTDSGRIIVAISERKNNQLRPSYMKEIKLNLYISQADNAFKTVDVYSMDYEYSTFDYRLSPDQNNIECWGMYSDVDNRFGGDDANGLFNITIDVETGLLKQDVKQPFKKDIIADLLNTKESKLNKHKGLPKQYKIIDVIFRGKERWLVFDNVIYRKYNTYDPRYGSYVHNDFYQFGSAIIIKTDKSCEVSDYTVIPKKQWSFNDNGVYSSMMVKEKGDRILLFFNDFIKNTTAEKIPEAEVRRMDDPLKSGLFMAEIEKDGTWSKTLIKNNLEDKKLIFPRSDLANEKNVQFGLFSEKVFSDKENGLNLGIYKLTY